MCVIGWWVVSGGMNWCRACCVNRFVNVVLLSQVLFTSRLICTLQSSCSLVCSSLDRCVIVSQPYQSCSGVVTGSSRLDDVC